LNVPDVQEFTITPKSQYLVLASDGLWDVAEDQVTLNHNISTSALVSLTFLALKLTYFLINSYSLFFLLQKAIDICKGMNDIGEMAKKLVKFAIENGSRDNTSVMVLRFN